MTIFLPFSIPHSNRLVFLKTKPAINDRNLIIIYFSHTSFFQNAECFLRMHIAWYESCFRTLFTIQIARHVLAPNMGEEIISSRMDKMFQIVDFVLQGHEPYILELLTYFKRILRITGKNFYQFLEFFLF